MKCLVELMLGEWLNREPLITSIDVLPSKNQALCEYCTYLSALKHY